MAAGNPYALWPTQSLRRTLQDIALDSPDEARASLGRLEHDFRLRAILAIGPPAKDEWSELQQAGRTVRSAFAIAGVAAQFPSVEVGLTVGVGDPMVMLVRKVVVAGTTAGEILFGNSKVGFLVAPVLSANSIREPGPPNVANDVTDPGTWPTIAIPNGTVATHGGTLVGPWNNGTIHGREYMAANTNLVLQSEGGWLMILIPLATNNHIFRVSLNTLAAGFNGYVEYALVPLDYF